ncbi:MAG: C39 family peptidase [Elusimicrobia bacterium]|nr:C39 family peptidase [Elusimicrobiota bacterium]
MGSPVRKIIGGIFVSALILGCAGTRSQSRGGPARAARIQNVAFFPDATDQCGPSTLAAILTFWGKPATPADLKKEIYLPKLKGTLPMDMEAAAARKGLQAESRNITLDDLKAELLAGRPTLVYLDHGLSFYPIGHYVVATGFDDARDGVIVNSGKHEGELMRYATFMKQWNRTDRWALIVSSGTAGRERVQ